LMPAERLEIRLERTSDNLCEITCNY